MNIADRGTRTDRIVLVSTLLGLAALYTAWYHADDDRIAALLVFALPPLLLGIGVLIRRATARFWAGVFALCWFSHGVMVAWAHPDQRVFGMIETALSLLIVFSSNAPGLRAKFGKKT